MTALSSVAPADAPENLALLGLHGILNPRSLGVARYCARLAVALADEGVDYELGCRGPQDLSVHYHLANSSRAFLTEAATRRGPITVTVHDVLPRTRALLPLYRLLAYPQLVRHPSAVVVHTSYAADLLIRTAGRRPRRLEVIAHPAVRPQSLDRSAARRALGWPNDALIAVLPGVIKSVKLVDEAVAAVSTLPAWRLALVGHAVDQAAAARARQRGTLILEDPIDTDYERAIVAADCVLCLRSGSVGETNGPLLDAFGAERAVVATRTGTIPEVAGGAALECAGSVNGIRAGLKRLESDDVRSEFERASAQRAAHFTWKASAVLHAQLFREVHAQ
jgi:glycosyltransferase involved in cell wall biosynthesis